MKFDVHVDGPHAHPGHQVTLNGVPVRWVRAFDTSTGTITRLCDVCVHDKKHLAECGTKVCEIDETGEVAVFDAVGRRIA